MYWGVQEVRRSLLLSRLLERHDADDDAEKEEDERDAEPEDAPHLGRHATADLGKPRRVGFVDFAVDGVVDDIPDRVHAAHDTDE